MKEWRSFSCGYVSNTHNFAVKNIPSSSQPGSFAVNRLISVLERGLPTRPSAFLLNRLATDHRFDFDGVDFPKLFLISPEDLEWGELILGDERSGNFPARIFQAEVLPEFLPEYGFVKNLMLPECPLAWILGDLENIDNLSGAERVDFFLPEAKLVIEIDGLQHGAPVQKQRDNVRDALLTHSGVEVVRISTSAIANRGGELEKALFQIASRLRKFEHVLARYRDFLETKAFKDKSLAYDLVAIARLQRVIAEVLKSQEISNKKSSILIEVDIDFSPSCDWVSLALKDMEETYNSLAAIKGEEARFPEFHLLDRQSKHTAKADFKLDISIFKRFDASCDLDDVIYVRNSFVDSIYIEGQPRVFDQGSVSSLPSELTQLNYHDASINAAMTKLLEQVFGHTSFKTGQLDVLQQHFLFQSTLGLLPTGAGKSLCFQFSTLLRGGCSLVICPITALVRDHVSELNQVGFLGRAAYISAEVKGNDRSSVRRRFRQGKLRFLFVSPEQLQTKAFRDIVRDCVSAGFVSSIVIDEVHCLSEWGHDFRTSYLSLGKTIKRVAPGVPLLALTATASMRVLKDIQVELQIEDEAICYHMERSRSELNFNVIRPKQSRDKRDELKRIIRAIDKQGSADNERPFLVFTPHITGGAGCSVLVDDIRNLLTDRKVAIFSGKEPNSQKTHWSLAKDSNYLPELDWGEIDALPDEEKYEKYKAEVQRLFKANKIAGICATKSFGMGVNKPNIRTTIHFGCPQSMEALYQEAGRAGRDRQNADCFVLFNADPKIPEDIFSPKATLDDLINWQSNLRRGSQGDFSQQLFMLVGQLKDIENETNECQELIEQLRQGEDISQIVKSRDGHDFEKTIYRLYQMGFVVDWTVEDFFRNIYEVEWNDMPCADLAEQIGSVIVEYSDSREEGTFHWNKIQDIASGKDSNKNKEKQLIRYLLQWNYDHFVYNRRQSLKTVYEACDQFKSGDEEEFRKSLEAYFSIRLANRLENILSANIDDVPASVLSLITDEAGSLKDEEALRSLIASLGRYLESYQNNPGLNLLSASCRLATEDFNNSDGRARFNSFWSLAGGRDATPKVWAQLIDLISLFPQNAREELATELIDFDLSLERELELYERLNVDKAGEQVVTKLNKMLDRVI